MPTKSKAHPPHDLSKLRRRVAELENAVAQHREMEQALARLSAENMRQLETITALSICAEKVSRTFDLEEIARQMVQTCVQVFDATLAWAGQAEPDGSVRWLACFPSQDNCQHVMSARWDETPQGRGATGEALRIGFPVVVPDLDADPDILSWRQAARDRGLRGEAVFPLISQRKPFGTLNLYSDKPGFFTPERVEFFQSLAQLHATALENARLFGQVRQYAAELEQRVNERTAELAQSNQALETERALLEQRVQARTAELGQANAELVKASRLRDEILAAMSHELRTPLNAILGMAGALQDQTYGPLNEKQIKLACTIEESGQRLLQLINTILDLSESMAGKLKLQIEPVQVETVCRSSLQSIRRAAEGKKQHVSLKLDPAATTVQADGQRLKQILVSLLNNAIKFTPEGGEIGLEAVQSAESPAVQLVVWDTGIGIAQENMEQLFQPFVQLDSTLARRYGGTGLGLALVAWLVQLHGGQIRVESQVGQGSRFVVSLPA